MSPATASEPALTLDRLMATLGPATAECLVPAPNNTPVTGPRIYDPADPGAIGPGDVVLGVNVEYDALIHDAATAKAAAVALKGDRTNLLGDAAAAARNHRVGLIHVHAQVGWDQLHTLIRNATRAPAHHTGGPGDPSPLGDLFSLANALAASIGAAVTIEDPKSTVLAYSNLDQPIDEPRRDSILGRRTPGRWAAVLDEFDIPRQMRAAPNHAVHVHDPNEQARDRYAIAITAGAEIVGSIWVVEGDAPLDDRTRALLEQAAPLAALHLLRHRAAEDLHRTEGATLLRALLDGEQPADEVGLALGIDVASKCAVVCFRLSGDDDLDLAMNRTRALDLIVLACEAFRRRVVCTPVGPNVYALFPANGDAAATRLESFARDIAVRATESLGVRVVAGVGPIVTGLAGARRSRRDADRAARVLADPTATRAAARYDDVRVSSVLLELGDLLAAHPDLRLPQLDELSAYDQEHDKRYLETLRVLAEQSWDVAGAARELGLHPNSLRYRIKRLEEISGLVLDDARHRLVVSLQFLAPPTADPREDPAEF